MCERFLELLKENNVNYSLMMSEKSHKQRNAAFMRFLSILLF